MQPIILALLIISGAIAQQPTWQQFVSQEGRFAAAMPNEPSSRIIVTKTAQASLSSHIVSSSDDDWNQFQISWTDYPQDNIEERGTEKTFNRIRDALVRTREGKVLNESVMNIDGHPGRVTTFEIAEGRTVTVFFCFARNRFYQVQVETRGNKEVSERFLNSFKLLPGVPV